MKSWGMDRDQEYFDGIKARKSLHHAMLYLGWAKCTYSLLTPEHPLRILGRALAEVNRGRKAASNLARTIRHECRRCSQMREAGGSQ